MDTFNYLSLASMLALAFACRSGAPEGGSLPHMPMQAAYENSLEYEWLHKEVLDSRLLSDAETLSPWEHAGSYGTLALSTEKARKGRASVRITSPTKGSATPPGGRPWGVAGAFFKAAHEDWSEWNRISFWIYPDLPGFHVVSINTIFYNEGEEKLPGVKDGYNFQVLENHKWNRVCWEIAHLGREKVSGFVIQYRLQGNEPGAAEEVSYFIDEVYLEKVEPDHFEGWDVQEGQIAYNHSGYAAGFHQTAILPHTDARTFSLINAATHAKALEGTVETRTTDLGAFQVLDFSSFHTPGEYYLQAGELRTKPFRIGGFAAVYRNSIIKTINHFYAQRCGFHVEGIHQAWHLDWLCRHGDLSVSIHGGWHDAGDLSQGLGNTAEAARAMMELAERLERTDPLLAARLLEEARWGLAWVMKTRFGGGYRNNWATKDMWTDHIIGNADDYQSTAANSPQSNFMAAATDAVAALAFREKDPFLANHAWHVQKRTSLPGRKKTARKCRQTSRAQP